MGSKSVNATLRVKDAVNVAFAVNDASRTNLGDATFALLLNRTGFAIRESGRYPPQGDLRDNAPLPYPLSFVD